MIKSDWKQSNPFIFSKFSHLLRSMIRGRTRKRPTTGLKFPDCPGFSGAMDWWTFTLWGLSDLEELPPALVEPVTWSPLKIRRYRKTLSVFAKIDCWLTDWEYIRVKSKGLDGSIQNKIGVTYCYKISKPKDADWSICDRVPSLPKFVSISPMHSDVLRVYGCTNVEWSFQISGFLILRSIRTHGTATSHELWLSCLQLNPRHRFLYYPLFAFFFGCLVGDQTTAVTVGSLQWIWKLLHWGRD